ncbi:MAG: haloacid dehalogenase type II [Candidatus Thiodiazotropha sp. (ex Monitilora ramsayi)]|nr:haloacid dehalogenase type II [Candidatus Thiodiazotropha sp. (ex Monitilora ramsayi)]
MPVTLAFDVYGTLIDTHGVVEALHTHVGDKAEIFSQIWRDKQLEYAFRRGLMQHYENFAVCTKDALNYTCELLKTPLTEAQKHLLLAEYRVLPPFDDVREGLALLSGGGNRLFAFSNGSTEAVTTLLSSSGILDSFLGVVSVDDLKSFKPNPAVYCHFLRVSGSSAGDAWLVSSNPFDVIGAISAGMKAVWLQRNPEALFDPWGIEPTIVINSLTELEERIARYLRRGI